MKKALPASMFVDVSALLCGDGPGCRNVQDGLILSFDGVHLTREGALYFGKQVAPLFDREFLQ